MTEEATEDQKDQHKKISGWEQWCTNHAKYLNENRIVHLFFGLGDGFNLATSLPQLALTEIYFQTNVSIAAELHAWMTSPLGIELSIGLCLFSMLGNYIDGDKKNRSSWAFFADIWPYMRDILKAGKWLGKAGCNLLLIAMPLYGENIASLIIPLSLTLGAIAALDRVWYRWMKDHRLIMEKQNENLLKNIYEQGLCFYEKTVKPDDKGSYRSTFVLVNSSTEQQLYYYNEEGVSEPYKLNNVAEFINSLQAIYAKNSVSPKHDILNNDTLTKVSLSVRYDQIMDLLANDSLGSLSSNNSPNNSPISFNSELPSLAPAELTRNLSNYRLGSTGRDWENVYGDLAIGRQSILLRSMSYVAKGLDGLLNGLYFYSGPLIVAKLTPEAFKLMSAVSIGLLTINVIAKLYEEYTYQKKLQITELRAKLAAREKRLHALSEDYIALLKTEYDDARKNELDTQLDQALNNYYVSFDELKNKMSLSYTLAFFEGLQNGLSLQSAITSVMYCSLLFGFPATQATIIGFTLAGVAAIMLHCFYALYRCYEIDNVVASPRIILGDRSAELKKIISNSDNSYLEAAQNNAQTFQANLSACNYGINGKWKFGIMEFEVCRVFGAGLKKTIKANEIIKDLWNFLQTSEAEAWGYWIKVALLVIFPLSFAERTLAKNYSSSSSTESKASKVTIIEPNNRGSSSPRASSPSSPASMFKLPKRNSSTPRLDYTGISLGI